MSTLRRIFRCYMGTPAIITIVVMAPLIVFPGDFGAWTSILLTMPLYAAISARFLVDSWLAYVDDKHDLEIARCCGERDEEIIAEDRYGVAKNFLKGAVMLNVLLVIVATGLIIAPPPPDTSLFGAAGRLFLTYAIYFIWRAKLCNRRTRARLKEYYEGRDYPKGG